MMPLCIRQMHASTTNAEHMLFSEATKVQQKCVCALTHSHSKLIRSA